MDSFKRQITNKRLDGQAVDDCNIDCFSQLRQQAKQKNGKLTAPDHRAKQRSYSEALGEMAGEAIQVQNGAKQLMSHDPGFNDKRGQFDQI